MDLDGGPIIDGSGLKYPNRFFIGFRPRQAGRAWGIVVHPDDFYDHAGHALSTEHVLEARGHDPQGNGAGFFREPYAQIPRPTAF